MNRKSLLLIALLAVPATTLRADSDAVMNRMLQIYTNTTNPQILETQRRGGLTLGRITARTGVTSPNLINFQPPSIQGGCNGIDLYGGSFSFINKDEMVQALRQIASNAVSYGFTLALQSVCPSCMQQMEALRDRVDDINGMVRDSCHWATTLVDSTGLTDIRDERIARARGEGASTGAFTDNADAETDGGDTQWEIETALGAARNVNVVWMVARQGGIETWFGNAGDAALLEVLMSVTGTLLKSETDSVGAQCFDDAGEREYCFAQRPSLLTVDEFIDGSTVPVEVYRCNEPVACLNPTATVDPDWEGFAERVEEILFGPTPPNTGLLFKLRQGDVALTPEEDAFLSSAAGPVRDILERAAISPGTLRSIGGVVQDTMASILARQMVMELIFMVERAFAISEVEMEEVMEARLLARQTEFSARNETVLLELQFMNNLLNLRGVVAETMAQAEEAPTLR